MASAYECNGQRNLGIDNVRRTEIVKLDTLINPEPLALALLSTLTAELMPTMEDFPQGLQTSGLGVVEI